MLQSNKVGINGLVSEIKSYAAILSVLSEAYH